MFSRFKENLFRAGSLQVASPWFFNTIPVQSKVHNHRHMSVAKMIMIMRIIENDADDSDVHASKY